MTKIAWDQVGERFYETGVSHGVFYGSDGKGVPWNGLTAVEESTSIDLEPLYFDGVMYDDIVTQGDYTGKITAFTYPDEFLEYEGVVAWEPGFFLADQPIQRFGLSYRTEVGNDQGEAGYKIHLIYNALAVPATRTFETMSLEAEATDFEWDISAIPEEVDNFRPTAHMVIDSRKVDPYLLADIEGLLYGTDEDDATLPSMASIVSFVQNWGRLVITDNGDGTWTAYSPLEGIITMLDFETFQIVTDTAEFLDPDTYEISSSELGEL